MECRNGKENGSYQIGFRVSDSEVSRLGFRV